MITVKRDLFFPFQIRGTVLVVAMIICYNNISDLIYFGENIVSSVILNSVTVLIVTTVVTAANKIEFDLIQKNYFQYVWILGLRFGKRNSYQSIEKVFINDATESKNYAWIFSSRDYWAENKLNRAFIKFSDGEKILLTEDMNKQKLIGRLKLYNKLLKTAIYDNTVQGAVLVE